jgi:formyltetrahydrofolate-dependent phosphoribosylglycinamide formyltransferase
VSGEGTNLQALIDDGLPIAAVASNREPARALARAAAAGIATAAFDLEDYESREERDEAMADWLAGHGADLVVCAGYMHLLTGRFLDRFPGRIVNVHPALLPRFPGTQPVRDALAAGVLESGATVHYVDAGVDTGPVIRQESVPVEPGDTVETLRARIQRVEHRLLPQVVRELLV